MGQLVMRGNQVVMPEKLWDKTVKQAHKSQFKVSGSWLRKKVWWPEMDKLVEKLIHSCYPCQLVGPRPTREPIRSIPLPQGTWCELTIIDLLLLSTTCCSWLLFQLARGSFPQQVECTTGGKVCVEKAERESTMYMQIQRGMHLQGDMVPLHPNQENKLSLTFKQMVEKIGSAVIVKNSTGQSKMWIIGHMKKFMEPDWEEHNSSKDPDSFQFPDKMWKRVHQKEVHYLLLRHLIQVLNKSVIFLSGRDKPPDGWKTIFAMFRLWLILRVVIL